MTIDEAIEIKSQEYRRRTDITQKKWLEADQLSIEALKAWKYLREHSGMSYNALLPGETEPEPQPTREEVKRYMDERKGETEK